MTLIRAVTLATLVFVASSLVVASDLQSGGASTTHPLSAAAPKSLSLEKIGSTAANTKTETAAKEEEEE
jgi:hypothetical protein